MNLKLRLAKWAYHAFSSGESLESTGGESPPGDWMRHRFGEIDDDGKPMYVAHTSNDGFEIWIAYNDGDWLVHFNAETARDLAKFILWNWWGKATWFGLKRRIWYWALHVKVMEMRKWQKLR